MRRLAYSDDPCADSRIAAEARQLFRATNAADLMAEEIFWFYFEGRLLSRLARCLSEDPGWVFSRYWLDGLAQGAASQVRPPGWLRIRGGVLVSSSEVAPPTCKVQEPRYCWADPEPFEFEMQLCPGNGELWGYTLRFGDARRLSDVKGVSSEECPGAEVWAFTLRSGSSEPLENSRATSFSERSELTLLWRDSDDPFEETEEWLAAFARQLFRARDVKDSEALDAYMLYLRHNLQLTLRQHLYSGDHWDSGGKCTPTRSVIGFETASTAELQHSSRLRLRAYVVWAERSAHLLDEQGRETSLTTTVPGPKGHYREPFEFDLELFPGTGTFRGYTLRFGDSRSLAEKELISAFSGTGQWPKDDEWAFSFQRGMPNHAE